MRKLIAFLLFATLCLGLFACADAPEESTTANEPVQTTATTEASEATDKDTETSGEAETGDGTAATESTVTDEVEATEATTVTESANESDAESLTEKVETTATATEDKAASEALETEEIETEDPRLSAEYAPVVYFDAKAIYELTKDGVFEDVAQLFYGYDEVTYHKEKGQRAYTKILTYNDYGNLPEAYISLCTAPMEAAPIFAVKYRTTIPGITMEIYTDSVNNGVTGGNVARIPVESDGEWHVEYVNLASIRQFNGTTINYFRFDFMNATRLPVDAYVDFEYFGFFNSEDEVEMFETGKYVPVIYVDENSIYTDATKDIVHASSIDMINGAGGSGNGTFDYRGGNSLKGVDKFNHNNTTLSGGKLVLSGWTVVEGGIDKFVWSIDGLNWFEATLHQMDNMGKLGDAHITATQSYTGATIIDRDAAIKSGGYQGNVGATNPEERAKGLSCDLLKAASVGDKVNVRFAVVPKSDPTKLCLIAYVKNVEVVAEFDYEEETEYVETFAPDMVEPEECAEHEVSYYWYPVAGEVTEEKLCLLCGEVIESRAVVFYSSFDVIEDKNGQKTTGSYGANKIFDKDGAYIVLRDSYDFVLQGWFATNGGVKDYMYSVDGGETWIVAGNSSSLTDRFTAAHIAAIDSAKLDIAKYDVKGMYRVNLPLRQFATDKETTVNVLFGAKLANNESVIITIANIKNVKIPAAPKEECKNHVVISWSPIRGQLKESGVCTICDENVVRDVKFLNNIDVIEGTLNGVGHSINPPDGVDLLLKPTDTIESRDGKDIVVQGWLAVNGGVHKYVYSIDGGNTWLECGNQPNYKDATFASSQPHIDAINGAQLGFSALDADVNGRYRLSCDLASKSGETVTVILGAILENNRDASPLQILVVTVNVTGQPSGGSTTPDPEPESGIKFLKAINDLYIGDTKIHNPGGGYGGTLFTYDAKDITVTSLTVKWAGWAGISDGINKWVYSTDGGATWKEISGGIANTTDSGILNALSGAGFTNATERGTFGGGLVADLSDITAATAEVIFAAVPNCDTSKTIPMVKIINIKLPNDCTHPGAASWAPVAGQLKESGTCTRCGETIERDITFVVCVDEITYEGGTRDWASTPICTTPYVVNNVASMPVMDNKGITVLGWVGLNGGVSKYVWSIDGETWYDAGAGYYSNGGIPGAVDGYGTGISNVTSGCQFNLDLSGLCNLDAGRYTVYFGAVPANNTSVVVPIVQIENVVVS